MKVGTKTPREIIKTASRSLRGAGYKILDYKLCDYDTRMGFKVVIDGRERFAWVSLFGWVGSLFITFPETRY